MRRTTGCARSELSRAATGPDIAAEATAIFPNTIVANDLDKAVVKRGV